MRSTCTALALLFLAACTSTAPHTLGAAAMNGALAAGAAAASTAGGGCYAMCTNGTTCNKRTGLCDRAAAEIWTVEPSARDSNRMMLQLHQVGGATPELPLPAGIGISPATGSVPPPPAEASPRLEGR